MLNQKSIIDYILKQKSGCYPKNTWGETSLFYNPQQLLPNGVYFMTVKMNDGDNDKASNLDRDDVYRINMGIGKKAYLELFGETPKRPAKGGIVETGHDFTLLNTILPHPIYAWMGWVCILSPSNEFFDNYQYLIDIAYESAKIKFNARIKQKGLTLDQ